MRLRKATFQLDVGVAESAYVSKPVRLFTQRITITDASGSDGFKVNSPAGEYGILFAQQQRST
jgi:hypothetical protein